MLLLTTIAKVEPGTRPVERTILSQNPELKSHAVSIIAHGGLEPKTAYRRAAADLTEVAPLKPPGPQ
jgi:hypothetical protein